MSWDVLNLLKINQLTDAVASLEIQDLAGVIQADGFSSLLLEVPQGNDDRVGLSAVVVMSQRQVGYSRAKGGSLSLLDHDTAASLNWLKISLFLQDIEVLVVPVYLGLQSDVQFNLLDEPDLLGLVVDLKGHH